MRLKIKFISLFLLTLFLGLFSAKTVLADTFSLSGSVKDSSGNAISSATVSVNDANSDSTTTDSSGNYSFFSVPGGSYNVQVIPASGNSFTSAIAINQTISTNTTLNFVLTPVGTVIISGKISDPLGNPLEGQRVHLNQTGGGEVGYDETDSSGKYSFQITSGSYNILIDGGNNGNDSINAPDHYQLPLPDISYTQSTNRNINIPVKKVTTHVQNASGTAISGAGVSTGDSLINEGNLSIGGGITVSGINGYNNTSPTTNASGDATLWLFPGTSAYTFYATPPSGSYYSATTLSNVTFTTDTTKTITLQQAITLSGHIYDSLGNPLTLQKVYLNVAGGGQVGYAETDASGNYSFQMAPGQYNLTIDGGNNGDESVKIPDHYQLYVPNATYSQNSTLNISAPTKQVSIHIQDVSGNPVNNVTVSTGDSLVPQSNLSIGGGLTVDGINGYNNTNLTTNASGNTTMWLFPGSHSYTITANPPSGSAFSQTILTNKVISGDTTITVTLQQPITISGHIYDSLGNPISGQQVYLNLTGGSQIGNTESDATGYYSFQTSSGSYNLSFQGNYNSNTFNTPGTYQLFLPDKVYAQNTTQNLTVPTKKVTIHVQDGLGNPVSNVVLSTGESLVSESNLSIGGTNIANGINGYNESHSVATNTNGDTTAWLFSGANKYTFIATPPSGGIYSTFTLNNVSITGNQTELISLQYSHATPVTTATLSPAQNSGGTYPNPVSVSLSATAASGYTVAHTYYTIDGGTQQTYGSAFSVSGDGSHTIHYWSDDNSGVTEAQNTKTFTIAATYSLSGTVYVDANQNGFQDTGETGYSGATLTLDSGQTATTDTNGNYAFSNLSAATFTETLTLPNGYSATTTNPATVALSTDTTENFGIAQANSLVTAINAGGDTQGNFVSDTDSTGGTTYSSSASVDTSGISNPAPQAVYQTVRYGNFTYTIPNLTANAAYTLRLHFNELYWGTSLAGGNGGEGSRVFNVSVNGTQALSNYDIFQKAGGANKAIIEQLPATADSNGNITIQFSAVTDNAMVNGIEVYKGTLPSPTPTPTPTPITSEAINAGGTTTSTFLADKAFTGGQPYSSTASVDTTSVTSPAPESVYQSVRYGNFTYALTNFAPNSSHTVRLHFNELYWGTALTGNTGGEGSRVFNVSINNSQVLTNFDIYQQAGGANKALVKEFTTTADANGKITIQFTTVTDNAMVNGIEIN